MHILIRVRENKFGNLHIKKKIDGVLKGNGNIANE